MGTKKTAPAKDRLLSPEVIAIIDRTQNEDLWYMAINHVPEPQRTQKIEAELLLRVEKYPDLDKASRLARLLKRKLSPEELELMIDKSMGEWGSNKNQVAMALRLPKEKRAAKLETILEYHIKKGNPDEAQEVLKELGREFTDAELESLYQVMLYKNMNQVSPHLVWPMIDLFSEPKRTEKLESMLALQLKSDDGFNHLESCYKTAKLIGRKLTQKELEGMLKRELDRSSGYAIDIARRLKRPLKVRQLEKILRAQKEKEYFEDALTTIKLLPQSRRKEEYELLVVHYLKESNYQKADEIARMARRRLTAREIEGMLIRRAPRESFDNRFVHFLCEQLIVAKKNGK